VPARFPNPSVLLPELLLPTNLLHRLSDEPDDVAAFETPQYLFGLRSLHLIPLLSDSYRTGLVPGHDGINFDPLQIPNDPLQTGVGFVRNVESDPYLPRMLRYLNVTVALTTLTGRLTECCTAHVCAYLSFFDREFVPSPW
jgi:hypothetical protein